MLEHSRSLSTLLESSKEDLSQQQEAISTQMREAKKQAFIAHQRYEKMIQECSDVRNVLSQCTQELASSQSQELCISLNNNPWQKDIRQGCSVF